MPVNAQQTAELAALAKSFTSSFDARGRLESALREHLGVTSRDSFWMCDDGVDDALGPVVIYRLTRDAFAGGGVAKGLPSSSDDADCYRATYSVGDDGFEFGEPVRVKRVTSYQPAELEPAPDEAELPPWLGQVLALSAGMTKAAGHRYIRRVPKAGGGYRYFYKVSGGAGGVGHESEFQVGAAFKAAHGGQEGHFHIVGKDADGTLRVKHDESGHEAKLSPATLSSMLRSQHAEALGAHRDKVARDIMAAKESGASAKQVERLQGEAAKYAPPPASEEEKKRIAAKADKPGKEPAKPVDITVSHSLTPDEAKKLDYRLRAYDFGTRLGNLGDELRQVVTGDGARKWVSRMVGDALANPFGPISAPDRPKSVKATQAKDIIARVEKMRGDIKNELQDAGHFEAHDAYDTHKIHSKAYNQVAENIDRALGVKVGHRMNADTAGVGRKVIADAALHGKGSIAGMAAQYAEQGRKDLGRGSDADYYKAPAYQGGPSRADRSPASDLLNQAGYAESRARTARDNADIAAAMEAKGFEAGSKHHRAVAAREAADAEFFRGKASEKTRAQEAERSAALKAELAADEAHLRSTAKPGEDVVRIAMSGGGYKAIKGKIVPGGYIVHKDDKSGHNLTHIKTGARIANMPSEKSAKDIGEKIHAAHPTFGEKSSREEMTDADLKTVSDVLNANRPGKAHYAKSMSTVTVPERDLAKSLQASHLAAAQAQPDAGAAAAHREAASIYEATADGAETTREFNAGMAQAARVAGLVKSWLGIPDQQRPPFDAFRKSMESPAAARPFAFAGSNASGDALGHLPAVVAGSQPQAEVTTPVATEPTTYSAQRGAVNGLRKSMGAFYGHIAAGAAQQAVLGVRCPPEAPLAKSGGPFIGPHGGKWADAAHTIPWKGTPTTGHAVDKTSADFHQRKLEEHADAMESAARGSAEYLAHRAAAGAHADALNAHRRGAHNASDLSAAASKASDAAASKASATTASNIEAGMSPANPERVAHHEAEAARHRKMAEWWKAAGEKLGNVDHMDDADYSRKLHARAAGAHQRAADKHRDIAPSGHQFETSIGARGDGENADENTAFQAKRLNLSPPAPDGGR